MNNKEKSGIKRFSLIEDRPGEREVNHPVSLKFRDKTADYHHTG